MRQFWSWARYGVSHKERRLVKSRQEAEAAVSAACDVRANELIHWDASDPAAHQSASRVARVLSLPSARPSFLVRPNNHFQVALAD